MREVPAHDAVLDERGHVCPLPVIALARAAAADPAGRVLLLADDPAAEPQRRLLDVQWRTDHLASLGVLEVPRLRYLRLLRNALALPPAF